MNKRIYTGMLTVLIVSVVFNCLSLLLAAFVSPDDLSQLAYIIFIFFPASAVIAGILSQRMAMGLWAAPLISMLSVSLVILIRYNSAGLRYAPVYGAIALIAYLLSLGIEVIIKKIKRKF